MIAVKVSSNCRTAIVLALRKVVAIDEYCTSNLYDDPRLVKEAHLNDGNNTCMKIAGGLSHC